MTRVSFVSSPGAGISRVSSSKTPPRRGMAFLAAAGLALLLALPSVTQAHNLDQRDTSIVFDSDYLQLMSQRAALSQKLVQTNDEFWLVLKSTPGPGTLTGVGGYLTFYIPTGRVEVIEAVYIAPTPGTTGTVHSPANFTPIPLKGQSIIAIGSGPIGPATTAPLIGLRLTNAFGQAEDTVTAAGVHRGTIAGVYADTGIFYSEDPRTLWQSWSNAPATGPLSRRGYPVSMVNNRGETIVPITRYDAEQLIAYGRSDVAPVVDPNGRGSTPWGLGNVVSGPQSGYAWEFSLNTWLDTANMKSAVTNIGPWQRVRYPGSQYAKDQAGLISSALGYAGENASGLGYALGTRAGESPLPADANAVRFSYGMLELGRPEYAAIKVRVKSSPSTECFRMYTDAFGGDAGGEQGGKDHEWRYYDPTTAMLNPCTYLSKVASDPLVKPGDTLHFTITFANSGTVPLPNVTLTDVLPSGFTFLSSVPAQASGPNPLVWNLGTVDTNSVRQIRVYVKAATLGTFLNTVVATSGTNFIAQADETVEVSYKALLREEKTVTPSSVAPGGTVTYTINVYNEGTGPNGTPLVVREYLPPGFYYKALQSASINGAALPLSGVTVNAANSNEPTFSVSQSIQADQKLVLVFTASVSSSEPTGTYYNEVGLSFENKILSGAPEAPVTVGGAQIGDFVWRDWDGDGVQDSGEEGIPNLVVRLYNDANSNGVYDVGTDTLAATNVTGAAGAYLFTGLAAGAYILLVDTNALYGYTNTYDPDGGVASQSALTVTNNEQNLAQDFGYRPGGTGSIGDRVFLDYDRSGTYGAGDAGISNVTVNLYEDSNRNGVIDAGDLLIAVTNTAADGSYVFPELAVGLGYIVDVDEGDPDFTAQVGGSYLRTTPALAAVPALAGTYNDADFGYFPLVPGSIGDQVFVDDNGDGVYSNALDTPLAGVTVWLYEDRNGDGQYDAGDVLAASMTTDAQGVYTFPNLPATNYVVVVDASDPDLPPQHVPTFEEIALTLGAGQNRTDIDFPFYPVLSKRVSQTAAAIGDALTYTVLPYYAGPDLLDAAAVYDPIPTGITYVAGSASAGGYLVTNDYEFVEGVTTRVVEVEWDLGSNSDDVPGVSSPKGSALYPAPPLLLTNSVDTWIEQGNPTRNYGVSTTLKTRPANATSRKHALLHFDVSAIPSNAVLSSASLKVNVTAARKSNHYIQIHRMMTPWTEGSGNGAATGDGATWNRRDGTNAWAAGAFGAGDYDAVTVASMKPSVAGLLSADISSLVGIWRTNAAGNRGLVMLATGTDAGDATYTSSDAAASKPYLELRYFLTTNATVGGTVTNFVFKDTYVDKQNPTTDQDLNSANTLRTRPDNNTRHVLLGFDVGNIPPGSVIYNATLIVHVTNTRVNNHTDEVHRVTMPWIEGATWNTRDGLNSWAAGTFGTNDFAAAVLGSVLPNANGDHSVNVTSLVNDWVNNGVANRGLALVSRGTDGGDAQYESREDRPADSARLVITWTNAVNLQPQTWTELHVRPLLMDDSGRMTVTMDVRADGIVSNATPPANLTVTAPGGVAVTKISGPAPAGPLTMASNTSYAFTYVYDVAPGVLPGEVTFSGAPTASNAAFVTAVSEGALVTPALTWTGIVVNVAGLKVVTNEANFLTYSAKALTGLGAVIGDFVWADLDGDGLQDTGEPGIPDVTVRLYLDPNNNGVVDAGEPVMDTATTDAAGLYRFYGALPGTNYVVTYDFATVPSGYLPTTDSDADAGKTQHDVGTLTTGMVYTNADFGFLPLGAASIGDTVWLDANTNGVRDSGEAGLTNITVRLYLDVNANGVIDASDFYLRSAVTDTNGTYLFTGLNTNAYLVEVDGSGLVPSPYDGSSALSNAMSLVSGTDPHAVTLTVTNQAYTNADFGYNWSGMIGDYVWWDDNRNQVPDGGEQPVTNAFVMLFFDANSNGVLDVANGDYQVAGKMAGTNGYYSFGNLPPGPYLVDVYEDSLGLDGPVPTTAAQRYVNLGAGQTNLTADFGYYLGARVEGNVFWDANRNEFFDGGENGLTNVTVYLTGADMFGNPILLTNSTDASGHFFFVAPEGNYTLTYSTPSLLANYPALTDATTATNFSFHAYPGESWVHAPFDFGVDNSGRIGDTIFADVNSNGVQNVGEPGLAGVTVELYLDNNNDNQVDGGDTFLEVDLTDATGQYQFLGLADGNYVVRVSTNTIPGGYQRFPSATPPTEWVSGSEAGATISGGNAVLDRDFGYPPVPGPVYTVSGTVWNDGGFGGGIKTNATQDGTEPGITNVTLTVYVDTNNDGTNDFTYTVVTDASGNYSVAGIPSNSTVRIAVDETTLPSGAYQMTPGMTNVLTVANISANATNQNFGYYESYGSIRGTVVTEANGNGVADVGETPVTNVTVYLRYAGEDGILGTADDVVLTTLTDATGGYAFTNLLPGAYQVTKVDPLGLTSLADADGGNPNNISVALGVGEAKTGQDFELDLLSGLIGDRVWLDENGDGVQDAGEAGLANVTVRLYDTNGVMQAATVTDSRGQYLFTGLGYGTYTVAVDTATLPAGLAANPTFDPDSTTNHQTTVTLNAATVHVTTADFGYNWAPTSDVKGNTGTGAIGDRVWIDADGDGAQDPGEPGMGAVTVRLYRDADTNGTYETLVAATNTDAAGSYIFDGLPAGAYVVEVNGGSAPAGYAQTGDPDGTLDNRTTSPVLLSPGDVYVNADFGYRPADGVGATIGDRVWFDADADGAQDAGEYGFEGVTVALIRDANANGAWDAGEAILATTTTGTNGLYAFTGVPVADGTGTDDYLVWVNDTAGVLAPLAPTYDSDGTASRNLSAVSNLTAAGDLTQDFGYTAGGQTATTGLIGDTIFLDRNANGTPDAGEGMAGVVVRLFDSTGLNLLAQAVTDANGRYVFGGLAAGTYTVRVDAASLPGTAGQLSNSADPDGGTPNEAGVTIAAGGINLAQDFGYRDLTTPNMIGGTIWEDLNGDGVLGGGETGRYAGVTVALYDTNGMVVGTTVTDASGNYGFTNLPDGTFRVDVTDSGGVLGGAWHTAGPAPGSDNNSQSAPYTVTVSGGQNNTTADFGYFLRAAALGNRVWVDANGNGIQDTGESGAGGFLVYLTIAYPNGTTNRVATTSDTNGFYRFGNLLLDEDYNGDGAGPEPSFVLRVPVPTSYDASPVDQGGNDLTDSDSHAGVAASAVRGMADVTAGVSPGGEPAPASYDFGLMFNPTLARLTGFGASVREGIVWIEWQTADEIGTLGYGLDRCVEGEWVRINPSLIPAQMMSPSGGAYEQADPGAVPDGTYLYRLVEVEVGGGLRYLGPFTVTVGRPPLSFDEWSRRVFSLAQQADARVSGPTADPDRDGHTNEQEFEAGTDPVDPNSVLRITGANDVGGRWVIRWLSASNCTYAIEMSTGAGLPFEALTTGVAATPPENSCALPPGAARSAVYRIRVEPR